MVLRIAKLAMSWVVLILAQWALVPNVLADTRTDTDYIALVVEAEDHSSKGERWVLTEPTTPAQENDPDANHSDQAVGQAYLELLPDTRVTHADEFGPPTAMWNQPGAGPKASYPMNFPEAGRYYVHLRAFSTGTEDNGIHIGLNNEWPDSGARMQFCTAGKGWSWSGRQRDSGGMGSCGAKKTIWITVEEAGEHVFMISGREDGFEVDRIMLIKDLSDNTRICSPSGADDIVCKNGKLENVDDVVNMEVTIESEVGLARIDEVVTVSVYVRNRDGYDTAKDVVLNLDLNLGTVWDTVTVDEGCEVDGTAITCDLGQVAPSGPEDEKLFEFTLQPLQSGVLEIPAQVTTSSVDGSQANDTASLSLDISDEGTLSKLTAQWVSANVSWVNGVETLLQVDVNNIGVAAATDVVISLTVANGLSITTRPQACSGTATLQCDVQEIAVDGSVRFELGITPSQTGMHSASVLATASNLDGADSSNSIIVSVVEPAVPDTETDNEADNESGSGTDTGSQESPSTSATGTSSSGAFSVWLFMLLVMTLYARWQMAFYRKERVLAVTRVSKPTGRSQ